ncbi:MAG: hypothetical protein ACKVT0_21085 [Planctomycetaceae bacterium]
MSVEVACWQCHGRLMIATPGVVVACPHCGVHLQWPPPHAAPQPSGFESAPVLEQAGTEQPAAAPIIEPAPPAISEISATTPVVAHLNATAETPANPQAMAPVIQNSAVVEYIPAPSIPLEESAPVLPPTISAMNDLAPVVPSQPPPVTGGGGESNFLSSLTISDHSQNTAIANLSEPSIQETADRSASFKSTEGSISFQELADQKLDDSIPSISSSGVSEPSPISGGVFFAATDESPSISFQQSSSSVNRPPEAQPSSEVAPFAVSQPEVAPRKVPMMLFIIVLSYASAMTFAFGYLIYKSRFGMPHQLESLPDLKPPQKKGVVAAQILIPVLADLPQGHTLHLGESRRFGNVRVTPLRVTKEPLRFEHYTGDAKKQRPATEPVLKLWLRFENVSADQEFCPLDRDLLLSRAHDPRNAGETRSNQYVMKYSDKVNERPRVQIYDLPPSDVWDFAGSGAYPEMTPGQQWETYIPTTVEGVDSLEGNLVWRVHIRKGYNSESFRGVTTLLEVRFDSDEIQQGST